MSITLVDNIKNSKVSSNPFEHFTCDLFNKQVNDELVKNFLQIEHIFTPLKNNPGRFIIKLDGSLNTGIDFSKYPNLRNVEPLNSVLMEYHNKIFDEVLKLKNIEKKDYVYQINIIFDKINYQIGPHTDSPKRLATTICYIVEEKDLDKNLGVCTYIDLINRNKDIWHPDHFPFDNFKKIGQINYTPGSTLIFFPNRNTFHGVEKVKENCNRMSIQANILNRTN
jgi:hypothetical protein